MNAGMIAIGAVTLLAVYAASLLQYGGAIVAADHLTWILGATILAAGAGIAGKTLL